MSDIIDIDQSQFDNVFRACCTMIDMTFELGLNTVVFGVHLMDRVSGLRCSLERKYTYRILYSGDCGTEHYYMHKS
jgi:hypothetical protein